MQTIFSLQLITNSNHELLDFNQSLETQITTIINNDTSVGDGGQNSES